MASRQQILERKKAVSTAHNMKDSKVGTCLLRVNARQGKMRDTHITKLDHERRRGQMHLEQQKKIFLKTRALLQPQPTILVVRPGSADRDSLNSDEQTVAELGVPGYMRPLRTRAKTPTRHATIDAFTRDARRSRNIWDLQGEEGKFRSCAHPAAPLSTPEALSLHQQLQIEAPRQQRQREDELREQLALRAARHMPPSRPPSEAGSFDTAVFVTQMAALRSGSGKLDNRVRFVGLQTPSSKSASSRQGSRHGGHRRNKAIDIPQVPRSRKHKSRSIDHSSRNFAQLEYEKKIHDFDSMTAPLAPDWQRMRMRNQRLPSADGIVTALANT